MNTQLINLLLLIGVSQGFLLGFFTLFSKYFRSKPNQYFSYTILIIALVSFLNVFAGGFYENKLVIFINDIMLEYLFPVTFLFYFAFSIQHPIASSKKRYWLFLPFIIAALINTIIDLEVEFNLINIGANAAEAAIERYYFWEYIGTVLFMVIMSVWAYKMIDHYQPKPEMSFKKEWLLQFWYFANSLLLFWIIDIATDLLANIDLLNYLYVGICLLFFWVSYRGIYQFRLAEEKYEIRTILKQKEVIAVAEPVFDLKAKALPENLYIERFLKLMQENHIYRDPELNRDQVANQLGISSGYFSQTFSQYFSQNFSEYINELRVEDVKRMLRDEAFQQYSLVAIGFEAGFRSKSSFYSVFKRITGQTPSAYKLQRQN